MVKTMQTRSNRLFSATARLVVTLATAAVAVALSLAGIIELGATAIAFWRSGAPAAPADLIGRGATIAGLAIACWLALGTVAECLARTSGVVGAAARPLARVIAPQVVRRCVGVALGVGLASGLGATAHAASGPGAWPDPGFAPVQTQSQTASSTPSSTTSSKPSGTPSATTSRTSTLPSASPASTATMPPADLPGPGWVATPPTTRPQVDPRLLTAGTARATADTDDPVQVVVHRGDSLWTITASHLGPFATDDQIAREWPRWYAANQRTIGEDPDLLLPGQVLIAPKAAR